MELKLIDQQTMETAGLFGWMKDVVKLVIVVVLRLGFDSAIDHCARYKCFLVLYCRLY